MVAQPLAFVASLLIAGLAGCQIVDTWHFGSIFKRPRNWFLSLRNSGRSFLGRIIGELFTCPFCLSHWTCLATFAVVYATEWNSPWCWPVYWLAVVKLAMLVSSDLSPEVEYDQTKEVDDFRMMD